MFSTVLYKYHSTTGNNFNQAPFRRPAVQTRLWAAALGCALCLSAPAADVLFYSCGKGHNFQQTGASTVVDDPTIPWEGRADVWLNGTASVSAAYLGPTSDPTLYPMNNAYGDHFEVNSFYSTKSALDAAVPNGTYGVQMNTVHDGVRVGNLSVLVDHYPNTPVVANFPALQAVNPAASCTVSWNPFAGGTTNDVIIVWLARNQYSPFAPFRTSPLPGQPGALTGTNLSWTIPAGTLTANSNYWMRVGFYKNVFTNTSAYPGVTGYGLFTATTTLPLVTGSASLAPPVVSARLFGGQFQMNVTGPSGQTYTVQASTGLGSTNWTSLLVTNPPGGSFLFTDPNLTNPERLYRVLMGP